MKKAGKALSILFAIILLTGAIGISAIAAPLQFTDVPAGAYFYGTNPETHPGTDTLVQK